ncbi:Gti1/Pac2 family-domain-containing protein [Mycena sp. CBHHK59/15]|nr:Gti1/Pac2 family-domain-containing protein [Mycena sp. CBHHK59/15]
MFQQLCPHLEEDIRDIADAHRVFEAVRLNVLPLIRRRLVAHERAQLKSGNVFVWEESEDSDEGGLVRWTEGRRWSQSRMRGDYLFYEEKIETTHEEKQAKAARRASKASDSTKILPAPLKRKDRPSKVDGLTKQTYSVTVHMPGTSQTRKWHIVAYFSACDYTRLPVVDNYDYLRCIRVPDGVFTSNRTVCSSQERYLPIPTR